MAEKLEKLEEELYGREEKAISGRMQSRVFFPSVASKASTIWEDNKKKPRGGGLFTNGSMLRFFLWGLGAVIVVGGIVFLFLYLGLRGQEVEITIQGRDRIEAGEAVSITVVIRNVSRTDLKEVELAFALPSDTLLLEGGFERVPPSRLTRPIHDLKPGEEGSAEVSVRMFGRELEKKELVVSVLYKPDNLRAKFSSKNTKQFVIDRVPLAIYWDAPEIFSSGQKAEINLRYSSASVTSFDDLWLRVEYPAGFTFESASPAPDVGDGIWKIGTLNSVQGGSIIIHGAIRGDGDEVKPFLGAVGKFNTLTKEWKPYVESSIQPKVVLSPLSIKFVREESDDGLVSPGNRLSFRLRFSNNTSVFLKNVSVEALLEGIILDLGSLVVEQGGVLNSQTKTIVWGPGSFEDLREIGAGETGELRFSVGTRVTPPVRETGDRNLTVKVRASIDAATVPEELIGTKIGAEDLLEIKVRSKVIFSGSSRHRSSPIPVSGPLPPKVGVKTSYAIVWEARNFTNDLNKAEVSVFLPPNVKWENTVSPHGARLFYDIEAGRVFWRIGELKAGIGILAPALTVAFLVSIIPSEVDVGKPVTLTQESRFAWSDSFTSEEREEKIESFTTELREESISTSKDWIVTP